MCDLWSETWPHSGRIFIPIQSVHTSTAQQHVNVHGSVLGIKHVLSIYLFIKRQRKRDNIYVIREERILKGGTLNYWSSLSHVHTKCFLLLCVPVSNAYFNPASQAYTMSGQHYMAARHACGIQNHLRVVWNVHMLFFSLGNTRQWKKPTTQVFMLYMFNLYNSVTF